MWEIVAEASTSGGAELCQFDLGPEIDMRQKLVEARVAAEIAPVGKTRHDGAKISRRDPSAKQRRFQVIERVEKRMAALDRAPAPLARIALALERQKGVEGGERRRGGWPPELFEARAVARVKRTLVASRRWTLDGGAARENLGSTRIGWLRLEGWRARALSGDHG